MSLRKHPFEALFEKALRESVEGENHITESAFHIADKGYPPKEVHAALDHFTHTLIDDADRALAEEALEEFVSFYALGDEEK